MWPSEPSSSARPTRCSASKAIVSCGSATHDSPSHRKSRPRDPDATRWSLPKSGAESGCCPDVEPAGRRQGGTHATRTSRRERGVMSSPDSIVSAGSMRELAARDNDGIQGRLLWETERDELILVINDTRTEEFFEVPVQRDRGLDAFHHPFAYMQAASWLTAERVAA